MKYAIPTDDGITVSAVFGRAASFAIYDSTDAAPAIIANEGAASEHGAGTGAAAFLVERGVQTLLAPEVGPKAMEALKAAGIRIQAAPAGAELGNAMATAAKQR